PLAHLPSRPRFPRVLFHAFLGRDPATDDPADDPDRRPGGVPAHGAPLRAILGIRAPATSATPGPDSAGRSPLGGSSAGPPRTLDDHRRRSLASGDGIHPGRAGVVPGPHGARPDRTRPAAAVRRDQSRPVD